MYSRRDFIRTASLTAGAFALNLQKLSARPLADNYFALNAFIEERPDAVFIVRTSITAKTNASAIHEAARRLGETLFVPRTSSGLPVTTRIAIKPNCTAWAWNGYPPDATTGIQTDANFTEGIIDSFKELGVAGSSIYLPEASYVSSQRDGTLYRGMTTRAGVTMQDFAELDRLTAGQVQWSDVPDPVWFRRIPHLFPVNTPGSCLVNIAKFKSHSMGMTLCSKNLQGTVARPYVAHCSTWGEPMPGVHADDIVPNAFQSIRDNYDRHVLSPIPRWGVPGNYAEGGLGMETHSSRCLDNNSVLHPLINIIEGVYGREGPFVSGPADNGGYGKDIMANLVIFGKNARHVDLIGTYLAGHEPGNFGFFHMAVERGLSKYLDPRVVPLFEWTLQGTARAAVLSDFPRVPIRTLYLRKDGEEEYHMVDEPYDYHTMPVELVSFTGAARGAYAELRWKTATEVDNYGFDLERSTSCDAWTKVAFVPGAGTSNAPHEYVFTDRLPDAAKHSYRLKQIDRDGHFTYSPAIDIAASSIASEFRLDPNYPNPFNPSTTLSFTVAKTGRASLSVYNSIGQRVASVFDGPVDAGAMHHAMFDASSLPGGAYFGVLESGGMRAVRKMMLVK